MNRAQQVVLSFGLLVVAGFCLRPPYQWEHTTYLLNRDSGTPHRTSTQIENIGHCWIWAPPKGWEERTTFIHRRATVAVVDWPRLGIYVGLTAITTLFLAFVLFRSKPAWNPK